MIKARILLGVCAVLAAAILAPAASADPFEGPPICSSAGTALSGSYASATVEGNEYVKSGTSLTVTGNLTIARGACLDAFTLGTVHVGGNVVVEKGAILALGCSFGALGPEELLPCKGETTYDTVGGSILANQPLTMYLTATTIDGSVISIGGGPGPVFVPYINYPIKENDIGGNLFVDGWRGAWFGVLRNDIHGSAWLLGNVGVTISPETGLPDSSEIVSNTIGRDLVCLANKPAAQFGDSGGSPNTVGGHKVGQCTAV